MTTTTAQCALLLFAAATSPSRAIPQEPRPTPEVPTLRLACYVEEAIARGELDPKSDPDAIRSAAAQVVARRLEALGFAGARVTLAPPHGIDVRLPEGSPEPDPTLVAQLCSKHVVEHRGLARPRAAEDPRRSFDLEAERARLQAWLAADDHRARVLADPTFVHRFHALEADAGGPAAGSAIRWAPHVIASNRAPSRSWRLSLAHNREFGDSVLPLFTPAAYTDGPTPGGPTTLLELVAVDRASSGFTGEDFVADAFEVTRDPNTGMASLLYQLKPERAQNYADWSELYSGEPAAIVLEGRVVCAPAFRGRIFGSGIISFGTAEDANTLSAMLRTPSLPVPLVPATERR